jgi:hypothetical protein
MLPTNWPLHVQFLSANVWENQPKYYLEYQKECTLPIISNNFKGIAKKVQITKVPREHPAFPSFGLYAIQNIPKNTLILDYKGIVKPKELESKTSDYILHFDGIYSIDAELAGNEGRFVNDFRGTGKKPNVKFELYRYQHKVHMGIFSKTNISKGQELLVTYGKGFWKERGITFDPFEKNNPWVL